MEQEKVINLAREFVEKISKECAIKFVYLFGSFVTGTFNNMSDVDIAVMFEEDLPALDESILKGLLMEEGKALFKRDVDIVNLKNANIFLKYSIIKDGIILKDHEERILFEASVLREYLDFSYYSEIYNQKIIESIKNKEFLEKT
ncbi:DNA polymerase beta domain protein region [Caldicellulosiruptor owensensis OL]|uniref:DNA polymerase beta domain protein region n=1 Tax=Caldicellulosiruptor owensensis (strain ATCC 700167 / DSM 13100 / OL) TaxID=632518 RepID=E4Q2L4_CALOW|nr:nucleotidyltransferase domain-containing protein [Caldicellulosiruptor owensensis]ADQ03768.1 DNA polymerase beta domain protein region [Caldicellulosiruptor owensensis OL]